MEEEMDEYGGLVEVLERLRQRMSQASDIWNLREREKKIQSAKLLIFTSILSTATS